MFKLHAQFQRYNHHSYLLFMKNCMSYFQLSQPSKRHSLLLYIACFILSYPFSTLRCQTPVPKADPTTVEVVRQFGGELFLLNSKAYLQPLVSRLNAATNSRTFHTAQIGSKFYVRFGVYGMLAFVNENERTYTPALPNSSLNLDTLGKFVTIIDLAKQQFVIKDTAGLITYAAKVLINDGITTKQIEVPGSAPTFFGNIQQSFKVPKEYLRQRIKNPAQGDLLSLLSPNVRNTILPAIEQLPPEFPLPAGQNLNFLPLGVPQIEIGSVLGTELLVRYIPSLDWGKNIGKFGFWGVGLKHSLSQYIEDCPIEVAVQGMIQRTTLQNTIGATGAKLDATADILNANIHVSKRFGAIEFFTGLSYDHLSINAKYEFTIPRQLQAQLGLIRGIDLNNDGVIADDEYVPDPANGYPGDPNPQTQIVPLVTNSLRWTIGTALHLGPIGIVADYNLSSFSMVTAGINVQF